MAVTKKFMKKLAASRETAYGDGTAAAIQLPFTAGWGKQGFNMIPDESILGVAFRGLPGQGVRKFEGSPEIQCELNTLPVLLKAAFGAESGGVYTLPTTGNSESLNLCGLDAVKTNKWPGIILNNWFLKSEAEGDLKLSAEMLTSIAETRDDTAFPAMSIEPSLALRIFHQHCGGANGYVRLGDQADALAAGDNLTNVKSLSCGVNWGFSYDYVNAVGSLQPQSNRGEASFAMTLAEHTTDAYKTWYEARTTLQAAIYYYVAANKTLLIEIPNIVIEDLNISDDDKSKVDFKFMVARNGIGTDYDNANMAFVSPIRITLVNS